MKQLELFTLVQSGINKSFGVICVMMQYLLRAVPIYSMYDYFKNGFNVKLTVAMDFTVSLQLLMLIIGGSGKW